MAEQYRRRLSALKQYMADNQLEIAIMSSRKNRYYYTGFDAESYERFMAVVIDNRTGKDYFFVPALDEQEAKKYSVIDTIIPISDEQDPYSILIETLANSQAVQSIGLETNVVTMDQHGQLLKLFPSCQFINISNYFSTQRLKKTPDEMTKIKKAINIIEKVLAEGLKQFKSGMTELELLAEFELLMRKFGADGPAFSTTVLSGEKSALPHGSSDRKRIEYGEFLLIDMGVTVEGYCSDITRTFVVGEATPEQSKIYKIVLQALETGIAVAKAGVPAAAVDIAARNVIKAEGYGPYFNNRIGHGLGLEVHEEPYLHEKNLLPLEDGFVFTVEPGIYVPNFGGVRIEENVYIEQGQAHVLTSYPTDLISLG